ncbi:MAG: LCP family protein [Clostridia bacterium]|nr:LCP family protein [Clostridia bacterium]
MLITVMEKNNNKQTPADKALSNLPLEELNDEQLNGLIEQLLDVKAHKELQSKIDEADARVHEMFDENGARKDVIVPAIPDPAEDAPKPKEESSSVGSADPAVIVPDPSCFEDPEPDAVIARAAGLEPPINSNEPPEPIVPDDITRYIIPPEPDETPDDLSSTPGAEPEDSDSDNDEDDNAVVAYYADQIASKKKQKRALILLLTAVGILLIMAGLFAAFWNLYRPTLDPDLPFTPENTPGDELLTDENGALITGQIDPDWEDDLPLIADSYERRKDVYNFLILGVDRMANLSDVIMVVSYDVSGQKLNVLQLPRDTYINVGSNYHKLNAYFAASYNHSQSKGNERYRDAIESMAKFIETGLCIKIDRYVCMDTAGFRDIIDSIGGVDMDVPFDMDYEDPEQELYIHLKAGYQHLDGGKAEQFVRFREGYLNGDIGRISAQKLFLTALAKQAKSNLSVSNAVSIAKAVLNYVTTNLTPAECGYFAKYALSVDLDKITFTTLPGGGAVNPNTGASYYVMYAGAVRNLVNARFNVYTKEISEAVFLSNSTKFTSDESYISSIFRKSVTDAPTYSADDIDRESLDIPVR